MPRSQAELEAAVRAYVAAGSGLPSSAVIPGDDAGPAPTEPYASVLLISSRQVGIPATIHSLAGIPPSPTDAAPSPAAATDAAPSPAAYATYAAALADTAAPVETLRIAGGAHSDAAAPSESLAATGGTPVVLLHAALFDAAPPSESLVVGRATVEGTTLSSIEDVWDVQFYREGAHARALRFRAWTASPLGILAAAQRGFTFRRCGEVRQLDSIVSETWEPRAGLELRLGFLQATVADLGRIERVTVGVATDEKSEELDIAI